jgi:hypothetical protein
MGEKFIDMSKIDNINIPISTNVLPPVNTLTVNSANQPEEGIFETISKKISDNKIYIYLLLFLIVGGYFGYKYYTKYYTKSGLLSFNNTKNDVKDVKELEKIVHSKELNHINKPQDTKQNMKQLIKQPIIEETEEDTYMATDNMGSIKINKKPSNKNVSFNDNIEIDNTLQDNLENDLQDNLQDNLENDLQDNLQDNDLDEPNIVKEHQLSQAELENINMKIKLIQQQKQQNKQMLQSD